jgi:hypothetical protein
MAQVQGMVHMRGRGSSRVMVVSRTKISFDQLAAPIPEIIDMSGRCKLGDNRRYTVIYK